MVAFTLKNAGFNVVEAVDGQDGFGFDMGPRGRLKVPQIGRVLIQDDVEIGANSCVDRGALNDTIIGQGTKIDATSFQKQFIHRLTT